MKKINKLIVIIIAILFVGCSTLRQDVKDIKKKNEKVKIDNKKEKIKFYSSENDYYNEGKIGEYNLIKKNDIYWISFSELNNLLIKARIRKYGNDKYMAYGRKIIIEKEMNVVKLETRYIINDIVINNYDIDSKENLIMKMKKKYPEYNMTSLDINKAGFNKFVYKAENLSKEKIEVRFDLDNRRAIKNEYKIYSLKELNLKFFKVNKEYYFPLFLIGEIFFNDNLYFVHNKNKVNIYKGTNIDQLGQKILPPINKESSLRLRKLSTNYLFYLLDSYYPNKKIIAELRKKYIEKIRMSKDNNSYYKEINKMFSELNDWHTTLVNPVYDLESVQIEESKYLKAVTEEIPNKNIKMNKKINIKMKDVYKIRNKYPYAEKYIKGRSKISFTQPEEGTFVIKIKDFKHIENFEKVKKKIEYIFKEINKRGIKNLIFDLRNNPGGSPDLVEEMLSYLGNKSINIYYKGQNILYKEEVLTKDKDNFMGKVVVLSNKNDYSAANYFILIVKTNNLGKIIGEKSHGGAHTPNYYILPDNTVIHMSNDCIVDTDKFGNDFEKGVEPDIYVEENFKGKNDDILDAALRYLNEEERGR
ncbi:S41 family peptidase [Haliovirga abyssi]|uniref:Tail specific protease domain-containing protein n=1 Tax=Haliovirga abyssi TaxID=2996794 RepID=A0AAU9D1B0_9FUSO|nr:S41 family peptidase [Haliovirga abyssi]BDU49766.1 hypothetical protein HLVA_03350 [Haliovirga abyssi]